jgi:hypothetical protein
MEEEIRPILLIQKIILYKYYTCGGGVVDTYDTKAGLHNFL